MTSRANDLTEKAIQLIITASEKCGDFEQLACSFNGGKDCTVLLHLFKLAAQRSGFNGRVKVAYISTADPFPEIEEFIEVTENSYADRAQFFHYPFMSMKDGFARFIDETGVKAILVGLRRTDPYGGTSLSIIFSCSNIVAEAEDLMPTDNGWPPFLRVHPLLDWRYDDIWEYIACNGLQYCNLYERGYTSLGDVNDSIPNPALQLPDGSFRPAKELTDSSKERDSRIRR